MGTLNPVENSEDYSRVARAIAFIQQNQLAQPSLTTVAQHIGLSDAHFQRLFTQWAGISPKRFLQYLNIEYAKSKISQNKSLLDLTLDLGLSSSGRLHDLFVNLEAMSPESSKRAEPDCKSATAFIVRRSVKRSLLLSCEEFVTFSLMVMSRRCGQNGQTLKLCLIPKPLSRSVI